MFHIPFSRFVLAIVLFASVFVCVSANAANSTQSSEIQGVRIWHSPDKTRLVFDLSKPTSYKVSLLENPNRYVVNFVQAVTKGSLPNYIPNDRIGVLSVEKPQAGQVRYIIPAKKALTDKKFSLAPNSIYGNRFVLDLYDVTTKSVETKTKPQIAQKKTAITQEKSKNTAKAEVIEKLTKSEEAATIPVIKKPKPFVNVVQSKRPRKKHIIVAIDAGHGGEDPGAIGSKSYEKNITLAISKRLAKKINQNPKMKAVLIRSSDYFVRLRKRTAKARKEKADLFISIHADAALNKSARGMSVFALSQRGASSELARSLARKENQSDLIGGVSIKDKDDALAEVLLDLSMTNTISESVEFGSYVLKGLAKVGKLHSKRVEQAGFAVLKSPDIPSILVETGFITNRSEERLLLSSKYQRSIVNNVYDGIVAYVKKNPIQFDNASYELTPSDGRSANIDFDADYESQSSSNTQYHVVRSGDYLSKIAVKYGITLKQLKKWNKLRSNVAVKGAKLRVSEMYSGSSNNSASSFKKVIHKVRSGDSLSRIAQKYGVTMSSIRKGNKLKSSNVYIGQRLKIKTKKSSSSSTAKNSRTSSNKPSVHVVKSGEYLSGISKRYNISISYLKKINKLKTTNVYVGQKLKLSSSAKSSSSVSNKPAVKTIKHKVRSGQTLSGLALKYRVKQSDIVKWNKLRKRHLFVGQRLTIKTRK